MSLGTGSFHEINMRRSEQDRREPRETVTAVLIGDPSPDRLERAEALREKVKAHRYGDIGPRIREQ